MKMVKVNQKQIYKDNYASKNVHFIKNPIVFLSALAYFLYSKLTTVCLLSGQFTIDFLYENRIYYSKIPNQ